MKAFEITSEYTINSLRVVNKDVESLNPHQLLVKVKAVSLNFRDLLVTQGIHSWKPPVGRVPASDAIGEIVKVGSQVTRYACGDRVAGLFLPNWQDGQLTSEKMMGALGGAAHDGVLQEFVIFDERAVIKVPDYLTDIEAATLPCAALTAWNGLFERGNLLKGQSVLIQGTGGVSLFAIAFANSIDAEVILMSSSDEKLELAKQRFRIDHTINYTKINDWEQQVLNFTAGQGADHIVEVVGGNHVNRSIDAVRHDGTISLIGVMDGVKGEINTGKLMQKQIHLQGIEVGSKQMFKNMNVSLIKHQIKPVVDSVFSFHDARHALHHLKEGGHFGKICISF